MFCVYCGSKIDDDSNYCTVCGKKTYIAIENAIKSDDTIAQSTQNNIRISEKTTVQNTEENGGNKKLSPILKWFLKLVAVLVCYEIVYSITNHMIFSVLAGLALMFWLDRVL